MPDGRHLVSQDRLADLRRMAEEGGAPAEALFEMDCLEFLRLLDHVETLQDGLLAIEGDFCEVCGCTQNNACVGGCFWVAEGLCSSCRFQVEPAEDGPEDGSEGWQVLDMLTGEVLGDTDTDGGPRAIIYIDRAIAEQVAREGHALYQVHTCTTCDWRGTDGEDAGVCPTCGAGLHGTDEWVPVAERVDITGDGEEG